ncbi:hypothetical protein VNI00_016856 [Paramarasmius palmivorus]|uniref:Uncharacterized protein n=1 Tax=Paramarasmius palmivorus TaxID=297713 RepID=A0AAW0BB08_9AGAR
MPHTKLYQSDAQRRAADRQKSQRYYQKNEVRKAIKEARELLEKENHDKELERADNRPYSCVDPIHNMLKVENALKKSTARIKFLSTYFDTLVHRLLKWDASNPLT